jgi:3-keto-5-aminohexanoate cleavage enzyme
MKPVIISVGVTGSITTRTQSPNLPVTPAEIADSALRAWEAGAAIAHIHVREDDGTPSSRAELYAEAIEKIRSQSDMLISGSTGSGAGLFSETDRLNVLRCKPEIASFDAGSVNMGRRVFNNNPDFLDRLAVAIISAGALPEIECFEIGMVTNTASKSESWHFPGSGRKWWFQFCLGVPGASPATANVLLAMRNELPDDAEWSVLGVGSAQLRMAYLALAEGGHVRVGLEDNVWYRKAVRAESNAQLVERIVRMAAELDRPPATPSEARGLLSLDQRESAGPASS